MQAAVLTKADIKETVRETLLQLGFNLSSPDDIVEHQKDMHYLRSLRVRTEAVKTHAWLTLAGIIITGIAGAIVLALTGYRGN